MDKNVYNRMYQVEMLGKEKLNGFFQERLIYKEVGLLATIKKNNLKTGIKSEKNSQKLKLFQLLKRTAKHLDKSLSLEEAYPFPITTASLPVATPDGNLNSQSQERYLFEIISLKNPKHYIQFQWKMLHDLLLHL